MPSTTNVVSSGQNPASDHSPWSLEIRSLQLYRRSSCNTHTAGDHTVSGHTAVPQTTCTTRLHATGQCLESCVAVSAIYAPPPRPDLQVVLEHHEHRPQV
jgi:hypothetical protein